MSSRLAVENASEQELKDLGSKLKAYFPVGVVEEQRSLKHSQTASSQYTKISYYV